MSSFDAPLPDYHSDRLGFSVFLATACHMMLIFGIGFSLFPDRPATTSMEITLATHQSDKAPEKADFLAQSNQQGSGDRLEAERITTNRISEVNDPSYRDAFKPLPAEPLQQREMARTSLTTVTETDRKSPTRDGLDQGRQQPRPASQELIRELASLQAKLDVKHREYSKLPRVLRLTTSSTKASDQAAYLHYWVERIEHIGNLNYPTEARIQKIFGNLSLAVSLLPDGSVAEVEVLRSSGYSILDQAAIRIVRIASPFAPFPPQMSNWDRIEIIRTWQFVPGHRLKTQQN